ncbi:hypothetical protein SDC9_208889 [bioreactor metagenome]|uniref:Uncharacterized protein n=1 Tax=bioreactor metagenome TaxID=1076179 RepID=A0A645JBR2_9ZZZZ
MGSKWDKTVRNGKTHISDRFTRVVADVARKWRADKHTPSVCLWYQILRPIIISVVFHEDLLSILVHVYDGLLFEH